MQPEFSRQQTTDVVPGDDNCRLQLARIIDSPEFGTTDRVRRFLAYVVEEALAGRAQRIKAYSIAVEVFGRDPSFDPQADPIVRVEAGQLRRALDRYYLGAGRTDPLTISIPKGGYAPVFAWRPIEAEPLHTPTGSVAPEPPSPPVSRRRWPFAIFGLSGVVAILAFLLVLPAMRPGPVAPDLPRLLVLPFENLTESGDSAAVASGLTQQIIGQLSRFRDIVVIDGVRGTDDRITVGETENPAPRYALTGSIDIDGQEVRLQARVVSLTDRSILWADSWVANHSARRLIEIEKQVAEQVATALGQPYGVIFTADSARQPDAPPDDWTAYACTLSYFAYRASLDPARHPMVRSCLERAVARFPNYATAWGLLSQIYIDEVRFRLPPAPGANPASVDRAVEAARRAVALDPMNIRGLQAQMFAHFFAGDMRSSVEIGRKALAINPNDTELMGEVGYRVALSGDWEGGCHLVSEARLRSPGPPGYYESALALCAYIRGDLDAARDWIRLSLGHENPQYHLIAAVIFGERGDPDAAAEIAWLRNHAPHLYSNTRNEIALRVGRPENIDRFMSSLWKAGLPMGTD